MADKPKISTPRPARGKRPQYFDVAALDQIHATLLAVTAELSVMQDRFDLIERVLDERGVVTRDDLEGYDFSESASLERTERRDALIKRLFRDVRAVRETK